MSKKGPLLFNLMFSGLILPGVDPQRARRTLAGFFGLNDPQAVSAFFSGKAVPLRRNLTREDAQQLYRQLRAVGLICEITPAEKARAKPPRKQASRAAGQTTAAKRSTAAKRPSDPSPAPGLGPDPAPESDPAPDPVALVPAREPGSRAVRAKPSKQRSSNKPKSTSKAPPAPKALQVVKTPDAVTAPEATQAPEAIPAPQAVKTPQAAKEPRVSAAAQAPKPPQAAKEPRVSAAAQAPKPPQASTAQRAAKRPKAPPPAPSPSPTATASTTSPVPADTRPQAPPGPPVVSAPPATPKTKRMPPASPATRPADAAPGSRLTPATPASPGPQASPTANAPARSPAPATAALQAAPTPRAPATAEAPLPGPSARSESLPRVSRGSAPNLFSVRPALASENRSAQRESATLRSLVAASVAGALGILLIAVLLRFPALPAGPEPRGPIAMTARDNGELLLLLPLVLLQHERSGLAKARLMAQDFGLSEFAPPLFTMAADGGGAAGDQAPSASVGDTLLINGKTAADGWQLRRCDLEALQCTAFFPDAEAPQILAIASSFLGETLFFLSADGRLLRSSTAGEIQASTGVLAPAGVPRLVASEGLLLLPANEGPLLGVYRPDKERFGEQLDALLLLSPEAMAAQQDQIQDIAVLTDSRWGLLAPSAAAATSEAQAARPTATLYRFDTQWGNASSIVSTQTVGANLIQPWRDKILLAHRDDPQILRFASSGQAEAPFVSTLLRDERDSWLQQSRRRALLRSLGLALPAALLFLAALIALLYRAEGRALQALASQRTLILDPLPAGIHWHPAVTLRARQVQGLRTSLLALGCLPPALCLVLGQWQTAVGLMPALIASLYSAQMLTRGSSGHLGLLPKRIILVDYDGRYFYGERKLLRGNADWLILPGVALPLRLSWLSAPGSLSSATLGPKTPSSRLETLGLLWHLQHPWLRGLLAMIAGWVMSPVALLLIRA